jgi:ParB family chromosome partitioning protein
MAAPKRTGLGRGISALIPTADPSSARPVDVFFPDSGLGANGNGANGNGANGGVTTHGQDLVEVPGARLLNLPPDEIVPNAQQPRTEFRQEELDELIHSIREFGVLQPIVVRPLAAPVNGAKYELIMGERRLRATKHLGLDAIPAVVKDTADDAMLRDALLENIHRAQLNPLEEASAYQQLLSDFGITQEELAGRIGRSRPQITNTIRLLRLPGSVQKRVAAGVLSAGHARAILSAGDEQAMEKLADKIVNEELSVRAAEAVVAGGAAKKKSKPSAGRKQDQLNEIAERLGDRLNTRVRITLGASKGSIAIDFASVGDLNRILGELGEPGFS